MFDAAWHIYKAHGIVGLYSGITVTLIEIVPYSALQFASYDFFHQTVDSFKVSIPCRIISTDSAFRRYQEDVQKREQPSRIFSVASLQV